MKIKMLKKYARLTARKLLSKKRSLLETGTAYHIRLKLLFDDKEEIYGSVSMKRVMAR